MASGDEPFKQKTTLEVLVTLWPGYTPVYLQTLIPLAGEAVGVTLAHVGHGNLVAPVFESSTVVANAVWLLAWVARSRLSNGASTTPAWVWVARSGVAWCPCC